MASCQGCISVPVTTLFRALRSALKGAADRFEAWEAALTNDAAFTKNNKMMKTTKKKRVIGCPKIEGMLKTDTEIEVARYAQLPQFDASILDTFIPRFRRLTQLFFGKIVSNPHAPMAFSQTMGYNMTYNMVPPGNGNALHMHMSIEVFVALDGRWEIAWGMKGENKVVLEQWDIVAVPARVCHSYKNIEMSTAQNIMTILPGRAWIAWAPEVVMEAREHGVNCTDSGVMLGYAATKKEIKQIRPQAIRLDDEDVDDPRGEVATRQNSAPGALRTGGKKEKGAYMEMLRSWAAESDRVPWKHMSPAEMEPYVHRFHERRPLTVDMSPQDDQTEKGMEPTPTSLEMWWKVIPEGSLEEFRLPREPGIDILVVVLKGTVSVRRGGRPSKEATAGHLDVVRVPATVLEYEDVVITSSCGMREGECVLLITASHMRQRADLYFHLC